MVPPPMTTNLQLASADEPFFGSTSLILPTTTTPPIMGLSKSLGRNENVTPAITTVENDVTCGWYSGVPSHAFECSTSLSCATNTDHVIACSKKDEKNTFFSTCVNLVNATEEDCNDSDVLCCNSINPSCMTLVWTASPTRSLVGCNAIDSTWVMLDYPFGLDDPTVTSATDETTSTSFSNVYASSLSRSKSASLSDTSQPLATSGTDSSEDNSPTPRSSLLSSSRPPNSDTVTPMLASRPSTYTVTTPTESNGASLLPINPTPPTSNHVSGGLSTGEKAGIGIGASAGMLIILVLIAIILFKRHKARAGPQPKEPQHEAGGTLQDNPSGDLPADIAPPARLARSLSTGWASNDFYLVEGASEVPVDMRGQAVGAVELPGSPVERAPIGLARSQYNEYQAQASQYQRYSSNTRDSQVPVSYFSLARERGV